MKNTIKIKDELSFSFSDKNNYSMTLIFSSKFVTPREIIRERVFSEVQNYNEKMIEPNLNITFLKLVPLVGG